MYKEAASAFLLSRDYKAVPEFVDSKASSLIDERSARLGAVKYFLWAIPSIGFVGTVVGIGNALLATIDVDAVDPVTASIAKSMVSSSIGVAFDTTLVALLLSLVAMLIYHLATQAEELVVNDAADSVRNLFIQGGVNRIGKGLNALDARIKQRFQELSDRVDLKLRAIRRFGFLVVFVVMVTLVFAGFVAWNTEVQNGWISTL